MRISDWSSDVCSSDLTDRKLLQHRRPLTGGGIHAVAATIRIEPRHRTGRKQPGNAIWPDHHGARRAVSLPAARLHARLEHVANRSRTNLASARGWRLPDRSAEIGRAHV